MPHDSHHDIPSIDNPETGRRDFRKSKYPLVHEGRTAKHSQLLRSTCNEQLCPGKITIAGDPNLQNLLREILELTAPGELSHWLQRKSTIWYCPYCGLPFKKPFSQKGWRVNHRNACRRKNFRNFEIEPEELGQLVCEMTTIQIASLYGVSNKAVVNRCKVLGISIPPHDYWKKTGHQRVSWEEQE